jgi:branched-chain amino acid aminotransferase
VIVAPADRPDPAQFERGLSVALVDRLRVSRRALDPAAKTGNYMNNVLALHEANAAGADDAVMLNERGEVAEGSTSNVYAVRGGALATPPLDAGILKGTTRTRILALARADGIRVEERALLPDDLRRADEAFLSSSVRGILPVTRVDGRPLGSGAPGPVTRRVHDLFERAADEEAAARRAPPSPA